MSSSNIKDQFFAEVHLTELQKLTQKLQKEMETFDYLESDSYLELQKEQTRKELQSEYFTDQRSGSESEDEEFNSIVHIDHLINELNENQDVQIHHANILSLMEHIVKIYDMVEFEPLQDTFEKIIAPELIEITNLSKIVIFTKHAYQASLPFEKIWASLVNIVLLMHVEMQQEQFVSLLWYICKSLKHKDLLKLDLDLVRGGGFNSSKLMKRAQLQLLISSLKQVPITADNVLEMCFLNRLFDEEIIEDNEAVQSKIKQKFESVDGLASLQTFNYDQILDLISAMPEYSDQQDSTNLWSIVCLLMGQNANKKQFFRRGQTVAYSDVKLLLQKLPGKDVFGEEHWYHITQILRFLTQKALDSQLESDNVDQVYQIKEQVELIKIQRKKGIQESAVDSVQLFHLYRKIFKQDGTGPIFQSAEETKIYITLLDYLVDGIEPKACKQFTGDLVRSLHREICDHKQSRIDQYMSSEHYQILQEIVRKLGRLDQKYFLESENIYELNMLLQLSHQLLEKKMFNYSVLNNF